MALVTLPEGQQRSGKQGGMVWSHNRGGPYVRTRAIPTNPGTARQVAVRNAVRSIAIAWDTILTQAQRDAWNVYATNVSWTNRLGESTSLTGLNHFIRTNTISVTHGKARLDVAPVIFDIAAAELALAPTASEATQQITIAYDDTLPWANEAGAFQFFFGGLPQNGGRQFFKGPYRYINLADGATPAVSPGIFNYPFPFAAGQRLWVRSRILRADGRLSEFAEANFLGIA
jgi:hypothetical protein